MPMPWNNPGRPSRAEQAVLPKSCEGRVSTEVEAFEEGGTCYRIRTYLGCAGLKDPLTQVRAGTYKRSDTDYPNRERRRFERDAMSQAAGQILAACAECPLSEAYTKRDSAEAMRMQIAQTRLETANAELAAAQARAQTAALEAGLGGPQPLPGAEPLA